MMRRALSGAWLVSWLVIGCGSDDDSGGGSSLNGPNIQVGETEAIDGAGTPAGWLLLDQPFTVRDVAVGSETLALVGSVYDRDFVFGGVTHPNLGGSDGLIGTLTSSGQAIASHSFGATDADEALAVAVRPSGNLVIGGFFRESIDLGGGPLTDLRVVPGFSDPYFDFDTGALLVFELDPSGELLWSRVLTSETGEGTVSAIALDENGDVIIAGTSLGDLDFGAGSSSGEGIYVARLGADGEPLSSTRFEGPASRVHALAVDASGVVLAGAYEGTLDLGGGPLADAGFDEDGFVARLDGAGALSWALRFGGLNDDRAEDVALTADGSVIVSGFFSRTLDLAELVEREDETGFAARIAPSGSVAWARAFAGAGRSRASHLVLDDGEDVIVGGSYRDGVDLGGGELPSATDDGFVSGLAGADGAYRFGRRIARFNFSGLARLGSQLFVTGTCETVCALGGAIIPPDADGQLLVAALSTDPASHLGRWTAPAELYIEGQSHPVVSAIALPGGEPENPSGITLVVSANEIGCSSGSQLPRAVANGSARRSEPELAILLTSTELAWHDTTSWLSHDGGGSGGSSLALVERVTDTEIEAYVEHHTEQPGSSATASYVMGKVTFRRCF